MRLSVSLRASAVAAVFLAALLGWAQVLGPTLSARVTDLTATLSAQQRGALEAKLRDFETRKGSQIAVLIVPSTEPESIEQYSIRVVDQWKLGRKGVDDGALLLVAKNDRALRIEVGRGLEGALTDADSKRIVSEVIVPLFKHGDFYGGIDAGVDRMIRVAEGEPLPAPQPRAQYNSGGWLEYLPLLVILAFVAGAILRAIFGRFLGSIATGGLTGVVAWLVLGPLVLAIFAGAIAFIFNLFAGVVSPSTGWSNRGRSGGGGYGHWGGWTGGGGGWGGGSSGGGFSGGGGGFSGGGASGNW